MDHSVGSGAKMYAPGCGLIRHCRGRVPHVVVATAEPTVGRIASIAQGTGDLDAVFHVALWQPERVTRDDGFESQAKRAC